MKLIVTSVFLSLLLFGCAALYHAQIGEIDNRSKYTMRKFDIKVSELGVSTREATEAAKMIAGRHKDQVEQVGEIVALFQMGPKTGKPVYNEHYARNVMSLVYDECPSGRITGLTSIREARNYPIISGEIIKVTGYCLEKR